MDTEGPIDPRRCRPAPPSGAIPVEFGSGADGPLFIEKPESPVLSPPGSQEARGAGGDPGQGGTPANAPPIRSCVGHARQSEAGAGCRWSHREAPDHREGGCVEKGVEPDAGHPVGSRLPSHRHAPESAPCTTAATPVDSRYMAPNAPDAHKRRRPLSSSRPPSPGPGSRFHRGRFSKEAGSPPVNANGSQRPRVRVSLLAILSGLILVGLTGVLGCAPDHTPDEVRSSDPSDPVTEVTRPPDEESAPDLEGPFHLLIRGGLLIDGTGDPARPGDLLVHDGRILHVGLMDPDTLQLLEVFDAGGLVVTPGFIDAHAHGDPTETPGFPNFLAQGVTTIVLGQDGSSPRPADFPALVTALGRTPPAVNVAWLVGHNTIRMVSGVEFGEADPSGLRRMAELIEIGLDEGAFGLSLGLEYDPGVRAHMDELVAVAAPVAARDGVIMSHMRNEDADAVEASLDELLEQGRRSGARVHASHMKSVLGNDPAQARRMLAAMAEAREAGTEVTGDVYPYTASFTGLSILFPEWARPPHDYEAVRAQRGDELAVYVQERVEGRNGPEATLFGSGPWAGMTLAQAAAMESRPFEDLLVELGPGGATAAYFVMNEEVMTTFLADPWVVVASDGSPTMRHPRGYGSFALVIRRYVLEEELLSLEEAVRKMTSLPAHILRLDDPERVEIRRGRLEAGWAADITAFDPREIRDRADFQNPHRLAEGVRRVWVNGILAWEDGVPSKEGHAGLPLRAQGVPVGRR